MSELLLVLAAKLASAARHAFRTRGVNIGTGTRPSVVTVRNRRAAQRPPEFDLVLGSNTNERERAKTPSA